VYAAVRLLSAVKDKFGVDVPASMLYGDTARLDDVIQFLRTQSSSVAPPTSPSSSPRAESASSPPHGLIDWEAEATLPDDIRPNLSLAPSTSSSTSSPTKRVLLTGATGFLGAFLLAELLDQDEDTLVRTDRLSLH
jgi:hypothetical protein